MWSAIPSCPGYEASIDGQIRSVERVKIRSNGWPHTTPERVLKLNPDSNGYLQFTPYANGKKRSVQVSRAVYEAFKGHPGTLDVDHIDGNPINNTPENLQAMTRKDHGKKTIDKIRQDAYNQGFAEGYQQALIELKGI